MLCDYRGAQKSEPNTNPALNCDTQAQLLKAYLDFSTNGTYSHVSSSEVACKVTPPFPRIFKPNVAIKGDILKHGSRSELLSK